MRVMIGIIIMMVTMMNIGEVTALTKVMLPENTKNDWGARCLDGSTFGIHSFIHSIVCYFIISWCNLSTTGYYTGSPVNVSSKWVIFLDGGGHCNHKGSSTLFLCITHYPSAFLS
jgi:hypothetical protein